MLAFKEYVVTKITNDPTMQGYIPTANQTGKYNIYPTDVDLTPEQFPCVIYQDISDLTLSAPQGMHIGIFQLDIYSINNALETETIYTRLAQLFGFFDSMTDPTTMSGTLWWVRQQDAKDMHDSSRRIWRKMVNLKYWFTNSTAT